jgi:hypothetical protein
MDKEIQKKNVRKIFVCLWDYRGVKGENFGILREHLQKKY